MTSVRPSPIAYEDFNNSLSSNLPTLANSHSSPTEQLMSNGGAAAVDSESSQSEINDFEAAHLIGGFLLGKLNVESEPELLPIPTLHSEFSHSSRTVSSSSDEHLMSSRKNFPSRDLFLYDRHSPIALQTEKANHSPTAILDRFSSGLNSLSTPTDRSHSADLPLNRLSLAVAHEPMELSHSSGVRPVPHVSPQHRRRLQSIRVLSTPELQIDEPSATSTSSQDFSLSFDQTYQLFQSPNIDLLDLNSSVLLTRYKFVLIVLREPCVDMCLYWCTCCCWWWCVRVCLSVLVWLLRSAVQVRQSRLAPF